MTLLLVAYSLSAHILQGRHFRAFLRSRALDSTSNFTCTSNHLEGGKWQPCSMLARWAGRYGLISRYWSIITYHHRVYISLCLYTWFDLICGRESKVCTSHCLPARDDWMNRSLVFICFYGCLPCFDVLPGHSPVFSDQNRGSLSHCWNAVAMFDAMKQWNTAWDAPPPTGIITSFVQYPY